ncbi:hypothetical protein [Streptomyces sp. NBC_01296]|uniref:hypothetical protein n=1 Tax=Streptomyces sp. NBC_01296 TaxID=2903816 RepID=UPI002E102DDE|nr:hypothetical protein OG299_11225 [Streptomyces sp. NBC_01296]
MAFPPGDMVAAFGNFLHFQSLESTFLERHPELADRVEFNAASPFFLKVNLPGERSVVLARGSYKLQVAWTIVDPSPHSDPSVWALDTSVEVLVDALHARAAAHVFSTPVPSPLRWDEGEASDMTQLADLLDARGVRVRRVVAGNRWFARGSRSDPELVLVHESAGAYVDAELADAFVRISVKPALGWMVDAYIRDWGAWGRVDLARSLWDQSAAAPGVSLTTVSVDEVADVIGKGPAHWGTSFPWEPVRRSASRGRVPSMRQDSLFPIEEPEPDAMALFEDEAAPDPSTSVTAAGRGIPRAVVDQLNMLGFNAVPTGDFAAPIHSEGFDVQIRDGGTKDLSLSEMERLNGLASAAGEDLPKRLILVTGAGISRPAAAFADKAKAFVFHIDRSTARLTPLTTRTRQAMLPETAPRDHDLDPW